MLEFNATFFIAMLSFVVFIFIMNAVFYKPVLSIIKKRDDYILSNLDSAEKNNELVKNNTDEYNSKLENAKEQGRKNIAKTIDEIQKVSFAQIDQAKDSAKADLQSKKIILHNEEAALRENLSKSVENEISSLIVEKLLDKTKVKVSK